MKNVHHPNKTEFQLERMILFSDAIFAIAITLLIIEIKVPELHGSEVSEHAFSEAFQSLFPKFLGFILSFFIIGLYWSIHHTMFGFVTNYTRKLIWLNLFFLFSIVLMPFTTAVYSEYSTKNTIDLISPYAVYVFNICLTGLCNFLLWRYIGNPKNAVSDNFPKGDFLQKAKIRSLLIPLIFLLSLGTAAWIDPIVGRFVLFLIPVVMAFVRNKKR